MRAISLYSGALLAIFVLAYAPDIGHGFVKDDFGWIYHSRLSDAASWRNVLLGSTGFYRPVVSLSFGLNEAAFGTWPLGYGLTNLALAIGVCVSLFALATATGLSRWAALFVAALWAWNFHGINMALLWLSGRTALCLCLFSVLAVLSVVRGRSVPAFVFALLALGSKEEAVALPLMCALWAPSYKAAWPPFAALAVYAGVRTYSGAFTPATAPVYYHFVFDLATVARNTLEYADRAATAPLLATVLLCAIVRYVPRFSDRDRAVVIKGLTWVVAGYALTIWLPVRSSLYALWPSIGSSLIAGVVADRAFARASVRQLRSTAIAALLLLVLLIPVYRARNVRWVELADVSTAAIQAVNRDRASIPPGSLIEFQDDRSTRANLSNAFGTLYEEAAALFWGDEFALWIDPPPPEIEADGLSKPERPLGAIFKLQSGRMIRLE